MITSMDEQPQFLGIVMRQAGGSLNIHGFLQKKWPHYMWATFFCN